MIVEFPKYKESASVVMEMEEFNEGREVSFPLVSKNTKAVHKSSLVLLMISVVTVAD